MVFSFRKNAGIFHRYDIKSCLNFWCTCSSYFYLKNFLAVGHKVTEAHAFIATYTMHSFLGELTANDIICDSPKYVHSKRVSFHKWIVSFCHAQRTNVSSCLHETTEVWEILFRITDLFEKGDVVLEYTDAMILIIFSIQIILIFSGAVPVAWQRA